MTVFTDYEQKQIDQLHSQIAGPNAAAAPDLCSLWNTVRPFWATILGAVAKIPVVGLALAALLGAFGKALDACCPQAAAAEQGAYDPDHEQIEQAFGAVFGTATEKPCCNIWNKVKNYWPGIVAVVRKVSAKLADILQKLGDALNQFCG